MLTSPAESTVASELYVGRRCPAQVAVEEPTGSARAVERMGEGGAPRHVRAVRGSAEKLEEVAGEAAGECGCPVRVDAEAIALSPGDGRRVALVHGDFDAMPAQALSQAQSSDAAARDQYAYRHGRTSLAPVMPAPLAWETARVP